MSQHKVPMSSRGLRSTCGLSATQSPIWWSSCGDVPGLDIPQPRPQGRPQHPVLTVIEAIPSCSPSYNIYTVVDWPSSCETPHTLTKNANSAVRAFSLSLTCDPVFWVLWPQGSEPICVSGFIWCVLRSWPKYLYLIYWYNFSDSILWPRLDSPCGNTTILDARPTHMANNFISREPLSSFFWPLSCHSANILELVRSSPQIHRKYATLCYRTMCNEFLHRRQSSHLTKP